MDVNKINYFADIKKAEGKRVALYNAADLHLPDDAKTIAVVDYEGGYYPLIDFEIGDVANWDQAKIDAWNTDQGLDKNTVDMIINQSMWPSHETNGRVA
jgi:hypothetical protein|tara:strand:- start:1 stop:297 length:297 start_codon:yes stop_codon:yes gene_type:complete